MEVVEHLYSLRTLLTEACRVLRPGGLLYVTTNNIADRAGLLRVLRSGGTNLDQDLDQTTILSSHEDQWRGHVRFYSAGQLVEAADRTGLVAERVGYFGLAEDPAVIAWDDRGMRGALRRWLRGTGESPPRQLKLMARCFLHLGPRSLADRFNSHLEILFHNKI